MGLVRMSLLLAHFGPDDMSDFRRTVCREDRTEPVHHCRTRLMANVDPALEQQVFDVPQRQREAHTHHHDQADDFGRS